MRVLINGLPYFGKKIAKELNEFDSQNSYVFLDTYYSKWDKIRFRFLLPFCDAVLSFNGVSDRSGSLDLVLKKKKKLLMQWYGTDVQLAVDRYQNGTLYNKYIERAQHLFSAPWFSTELQSVVEDGTYAPFSFVDQIGNSEVYTNISILTYLSKGREEYYGWNQIEKAAEAYPEYAFKVVGSDGEGLSAPANIEFLGWREDKDMLRLYRQHPIFVRLCEHDGKAFSVSQAIAAGAEVIWNYNSEYVQTINRTADDLIDAIREAEKRVKSRNMQPNVEAIEYANSTLKREIVLEQYTVTIQKELLK